MFTLCSFRRWFPLACLPLLVLPSFSHGQEDSEAEANALTSQFYLLLNSGREGVTTTESGLQYKVIEKGAGEDRPFRNAMVKMHYKLSLIDGTVVHDTKEIGEPYHSSPFLTLPKGLVEGIQLMSAGAKCRFFLPPELGFKESGSADIPPNSVLIYEVELLSFKNPTEPVDPGELAGLYYPSLTEAMEVSISQGKALVLLLGSDHPNDSYEATTLTLIKEQKDSLKKDLVLGRVSEGEEIQIKGLSERKLELIRAIKAKPTLCLFLPLKDEFSFVGHSESGAVNCLAFIETAAEKAANHERGLLAFTTMFVNQMDSEVKATESGLQYKIIQEGEGSKPRPRDTVTFHYEARLTDKSVFDSSIERGDPLEVQLTSIIPGLTEGLQLMSPGGKWQFTIPPELAYGEKGDLKVPGNSVVIYDVELLRIEPFPYTWPGEAEPDLKEIPNFFYRSFEEGMNAAATEKKPLLVLFGCGREGCPQEKNTYDMLVTHREAVGDAVILTVASGWHRTEDDILLSQVSEAGINKLASIANVPTLCLFLPTVNGFDFVGTSEAGADKCLSYFKDVKKTVAAHKDPTKLDQRVIDQLLQELFNEDFKTE